MKKSFLLAIFATSLLFANKVQDISFTIDHNSFDDPVILRDHKLFYGIRGGIYDKNIGYQLGYEQANGANCVGLNLKRFYTNILFFSQKINSLKPYATLTTGYELSNIKKYKPNQLFIGGGVGIKIKLNPSLNGFIESRLIKKLTTHDTDISTTLGLSYLINRSKKYTTYRYNQEDDKQSKILLYNTTNTHTSSPEILKQKKEKTTKKLKKYFYIQTAALLKTDPSSYIDKLYKKGIENVEVRVKKSHGQYFSIILIGPYKKRSKANYKLHKIRQFSKNAFITKQ